MMYVIIYTNKRTVQGHPVYCLVSKVNTLLQGKVQRVTPTCPMQISTIVLCHLREIVGLVFGVNFIHVRNCWIFIHLNEISFLGLKWLKFLSFERFESMH